MVVEKLVVTALLLIASAVARANTVEVWECRDLNDRSGPVLVTATVDSGREKGSIAVAGVKHETQFRVAGFNRRWNFGKSPNGMFQYSFVIEPNGIGNYVEFNNESKATPRNFMRCRQAGAGNPSS